MSGRSLPFPGFLAGAVVAAAAVFFLIWELAHRGVYAYATGIYPIDDADEWRYTACSRLVAHGYHLFDQVFSAQPPLLFLSLAGAMKVSGETITGARSAETVLGLLGMLAAVWLAWQLAGRWAAAATAVVLAVSPTLLIYAHTVEAEGPMMALGALALAFGVAASRRDSLPLSLLAGLALAGAVLFKLFALENVLPLAWALAGVWPLSRRCLLRASIAGIGAIVPLGLDFGLISPVSQWRQVIELHNRVAAVALPNLLPPGRILWDFFSLDAGLSVLALAGLLAAVLARRFYLAGLLLLWLPGSVAMLLLFHPLFPHHAAILAAPLGVSAGAAVGLALEHLAGKKMRQGLEWRAWLSSSSRHAWSPYIAVTRSMCGAVVAALAALAYIALLPRVAHADRHVLLSPPAEPGALITWVARYSAQAQFVASGDVRVAVLAGRLVPPPLCDPSVVRAAAGYLTAADLIGATERYRPVIVLPTGALAERSYIRWLGAHYHAVSAPSGIAAYLLLPGSSR